MNKLNIIKNSIQSSINKRITSVMKDSGQQIDRLGIRIAQNHIWKQELSRHRNLMPLQDLVPQTGQAVFVAPNASVIGEVLIDEYSTVWHNTVIRGDLNGVLIGRDVHILDNVVISTVSSLPTGVPSQVRILANTIIQPNCTIISSYIGNDVFIGSNSVILEGCRIEDKVRIEAGSIVPPGSLLESGMIQGGNPLRELGKVDQNMEFQHKRQAESIEERKIKQEEEQIGDNFNQVEREKNPQQMRDIEFDTNDQSTKFHDMQSGPVDDARKPSHMDEPEVK